MTLDFYTQLDQRRRAWEPAIGSKEAVAPGAIPTLTRCLAARCLEIPVGQWVADGINRELKNLSPEAISLLQKNQADELKHDQVLTSAALTYDLLNPRIEAEANTIAQTWIDHPDHPIVKAAVLESSVFFVVLPILRLLGNTGLRTVSFDISNDETIHTATNRAVAKQLGYTMPTPSKITSLDLLRQQTIDWLLTDLVGPGKWYNRSTWRSSSDSLLYSGKAPNLVETKRARLIAPYEVDNRVIPKYY